MSRNFRNTQYTTQVQEVSTLTGYVPEIGALVYLDEILYMGNGIEWIRIYDSNIPPVDGLIYQGTWNAETNTPALESGEGTTGDFYIVNTAGTTDLDGVTDWQVGDWVIFEGGAWIKIDNHDIQAYTTVKDESTQLPRRSVLKFEGTGVTASDVSGETVIDISTPNLQTVTDVGAETTNTLYVGDLDNFYSEISSGAVGTANVPNETYAFIGQDATLGLNNGDTESLLKNTNVSAGNAVILEFPDKTSGSYTIATLEEIIPNTNYGLFAQTGDSVAVTAITTETTLINGGVGTLSVPANAFQVGDTFRAHFAGLMSAKNNDSIRIRVKAGSVVLADSGLQTMPSTTNAVWSLSLDFTIRQLGGAGTASVVTIGNFLHVKQSNNTSQGFGFNTVNDTTFNTTISNTLNVTAQWSSNSALNSIYSDVFVLNKVY